MEQGVHLVTLVSSLQQSQTKEILERELRSFIHQVRSGDSFSSSGLQPPTEPDQGDSREGAEVLHSSGEVRGFIQWLWSLASIRARPRRS
jgi:hypothetical protein